jgi:hypothetical protein
MKIHFINKDQGYYQKMNEIKEKPKFAVIQQEILQIFNELKAVEVVSKQIISNC